MAQFIGIWQAFVNLVPVGWAEGIAAGLVVAGLVLTLVPGPRSTLVKVLAVIGFVLAAVTGYASQLHEEAESEREARQHEKDVKVLTGTISDLSQVIQSDHEILSVILSDITFPNSSHYAYIESQTVPRVSEPTPKPGHVIAARPVPRRVVSINTPAPRPAAPASPSPIAPETPVPGPHLQYAVKKISSKSTAYPYAAEITIQTDRDIEQPSIVVVFDRSVKLDPNPGDVDFYVANGSGTSMMFNQRISVGFVRGVFPAVLASYSGPGPFLPDAPLVVRVSASTPIIVVGIVQVPH